MTPRECSELLTYASIIDNRTVAPETAAGWQVFERPDRSSPGAIGRPRMVTHGRRRMYALGCRCAPCAAANTDYYRKRRTHDPA